MTESDAPTRHGRRARRLTPEEEAAQQARAASSFGDGSAAPAARGAVAPPGADEPVPRLRKFGRRARIIELADPVDATVVTAPSDAAAPAADGSDAPQQDAPGRNRSTGNGAGHVVPHDDAGAASAQEPTGSSAPAAAAPATATATIERDSDGVELGEMSVSEAPDPRPAPRFEGRVLQRSDDSGGRSLLWVVWVVIGLALLTLIILLATGVLGPGDTGAMGALGALAVPAMLDPASAPLPTPLEVTSA